MMPPKVEPALARRLEMLTGEEASCCVRDYAADVRTIQAGPRFERSLTRAKAMADEKRLMALAFIKRRKEACACEVQAALDLTHATVSHHMSVLAEAGLVEAERRGKWVYYRIPADAEETIP